jgi:diguanylate cyclase (GGDEF)-like protein
MPYRIAVRHAVSRRVGRISCVAAVLVGVFALCILAAWLLGLDDHPALRAGVLATKANAAAALLCEAAALYLMTRAAPGSRSPRCAQVLLMVPIAIAAAALAESSMPWDAGIDRLLAPDAFTPDHPGLMSALSAICLLALAVALYCAMPRRRAARLASQLLAMALLTTATLTLLGHLYAAPALYRIGQGVPMATATALAVAGLALGTLFLHPEDGIVTALALDRISARMGRRLLLSAALILPGLAWLRIQGQQSGLYDTSLGTGLVVTLALLMFALLVGFHTHALGRAEDRIQYLNRVYGVLSDINSLIVRTGGRDELLAEASRIAVERGGFPRAWFGLVDAGRGAVKLAGDTPGTNGLDENDRRLSLLDLGAGYSPIGLAVHTRQPVVSNDVAADPRGAFTAELLAHGIRSYAVFPLLSGDRVLGIFKLHAEVPQFFHGEELQLLAEMAGDVTFAIEHLEQKQIVDHLAYFDALTGLANARLLEDRLQQAIDHALQLDAPFALLVIDIIAFKMVNDAYGRHVGDEALRTVARRIGAAAGEGRCARLGSNLFAILIPALASESDVAQEYERVLHAAFGTFNILNHTFDLAPRAGIAMVPVDGTEPAALLRNAEAALDEARLGGQRYRFHAQSSNARVAERMEMRRLLGGALAKGEFALHYQIKVNSRTRRPDSAEALLRWHSSEYGMVPPSTFVPILEETGLIETVGLWALGQAARDSLETAATMTADFRFAVNVSVLQLLQPGFADSVAATFGPFAGSAQLDIEITESLLMRDVEDAIAKLRRLRAMGFKIAIDDFGTGYSSMAYLARLPVDYLKIDRSFVVALPDNPEGIAVVTAIISLAHSLRLGVIAEGVETAAQAALLTALGCEQLQGYHFGKPEPLADLLRRLRSFPPALTASHAEPRTVN